MKVTIIKDDNAVYKDNISYMGLDLPFIPADIHALQWKDTTGWIEYNDEETQPQPISMLPSWAEDCLLAWQKAYDEEQAFIELEKKLEAERLALEALEEAERLEKEAAKATSVV